MLTTPHATAGIAIGVLLVDPILVIPVAFASHFVLDSIPHWQETLAPYRPNSKTFIRIPIDFSLAVGLTILATQWQPQATLDICLGAIFANVPDLDCLLILHPRWKHGFMRKFWNWHCKIQRETSSLRGVPAQLVVIAVAMFIAKTY